jgi:chromosome segregation ATPase
MEEHSRTSEGASDVLEHYLEKNKQLLERLASTQKQLIEDVNRIQTALEELSLRDKIREAEGELARLQTYLKKLKKVKGELKQSIRDNKEKAVKLNHSVEKEQREALRYRREVESMLNSRSWRLTKFSRNIGMMVKGKRKTGR